MKEKARADGSFDKLNARLVAGGHQQDRSIYTKEETASLTVATASVFTCATIAAQGCYNDRHCRRIPQC